MMIYRTADLYDAHGDTLQVCEAPLSNYGARNCFHGKLRTVKCHEDNALAKKILSEPGAAQVLVVDGGRSLHTALMGDLIAQLACGNGWAGVVVWAQCATCRGSRQSTSASRLPGQTRERAGSAVREALMFQ